MRIAPTPYVAVVGAALSANKGAASMLLALADNIDEVVPGGRLVSLSTYPQADGREAGASKIDIVDYRPRTMVLLHLPLAILAGIARLLGGSGRTFMRTRALRILRDAEVVADLAGISFSDGRGLPTLVYNSLMTGIPLMIGAPVVKCSQAIGPLQRFDTRLAARLVLPRLNRVVARGRGTFDHLESFGLSNVVEGSDLAFLMDTDENDDQTAGGFVDDLSSGFFLVSASSVVEELCDREGIDYPRLMADLIKRLVAETGLSAVLVAHSARPGHPKSRMNDLPVISEIGELLSDAKVKAVEESLDPRVLRALIARSEFLLASRFHAMISGLATGTPTVVVGWSHKYREVMQEFGLEDFVVAFSEFNVETLVEISTTAWQRRGDVSNQIQAALPTVRDSAKTSLRSLMAAANA